jgi:CHAT domain-containing protein/tetratricopeptide (TPR) repeat protein
MNQKPGTPLQFGQITERELTGGRTHVYQVSLSAGDFLRIEADQHGIAIEVKIFDPAQQKLVQMDSFNGTQGPEIASVIAAQTGNYRIEITSTERAVPPGRYEVKVAQQRRAIPEDQMWVNAQTAYSEGIQLRAQPAAESRRQAIQRFEEALKIWLQLGDHLMAAHTLYYIASGHRNFGDRQRGLNTLLQAQERLQAAGETREDATLVTNIAIYENELGQSGKAIAHFEQALKIWRQLGDSYGEARALSNLALTLRNAGENEKALEIFHQAVSFWQKLNNQRALADTLLPTGQSYDVQGDWQKSLECYEQALAIFREEKYLRGEGQTLNEIGLIYERLGEFGKWMEYSNLALSLWRKSGDRRYLASTLVNLGAAESMAGDPQRAIDHFREAIKLYKELGDRSAEAVALRELGKHYARLQNYQTALDHYQQSWELSTAAGTQHNEDNTKWVMGEAYHAMQRFDEAAGHYEQALVMARQNKNPSTEANILYEIAINERSRGNMARSRTLVEESLRINESLRLRLISPQARASFLVYVQKSYRLYTELLMHQHRLEPTKGLNARALEISERQRARSLLDLLTEANTNLREGVDPALIEREQALAKQLNDKAQMQVSTSEQTATLKREISQLETDLERAQAAIRKASPHYAALTQPQPLKLTEIQAQLDADTLMLEYALGAERSYLWAISKDSLTSYELPKEALIKQSALQLHELLSARSATKRGESALQRQQRIAQAEADLPAAAAALSQTLLAPVAQQLGNKRLVIVADGALQYIPFAMLPDPGAGRRSPVAANSASSNQPPAPDYRPLIVSHEVVSLPSASALAIQRAELTGRQPAPKMLAVIADPVFDRNDARFKSLAPETNDKAQLQTIAFNDARSIEHLAEKSDDKSGVTTRRLVIPRLPFTRQEATRLLALTPKASRFGAIDFQASRATVLKGDLAQYRYVHFATHGLLDSERPGLSSLVLSMVDAEGKSQNGFLRANDIYNLKLPAELVVLSACQTGLGKEIKGEGLVGLTRGFMYAGAARVVVSLWSVNDKATAELMSKFYEKMLKQGERPAAALRTAQVEMWKQKQWQSPYYWAAFTLQGEWK